MRLLISILLLVMLSSLASAQDGVEIYWTSPRGIFKADVETGVVSELFRVLLSEPRDIELDVAGGKMYWFDTGTNKIQRANLDGSDIEDVIDDPYFSITDIALDVDDNKIYWTDSWAAIQWAHLDGSNRQNFRVPGKGATSIALDLNARKMYWIEEDVIKRANMDRTEVDVLVSGLINPQDMALDPKGGKMYWVDWEYGNAIEKIWRANLDGSDKQIFIQHVNSLHQLAINQETGRVYWVTGHRAINSINRDGSDRQSIPSGEVVAPKGLTIDATTGKLYVVNDHLTTRKIQRINVDATELEDLIVSEFLNPRDISVDVQEGKVYWADFAAQKIQRSNLDGSGLEDLVAYPDVLLARVMAIDPVRGNLYWERSNRVMRADLDGANKGELFPTDPTRWSLEDMEIDLQSGKLYWVSNKYSIQRINVDGSGLEDIKLPDGLRTNDIVLDIERGKIYWANERRDIERANIDGTDRDTLFTAVETGRAPAPDNLSLDPVNEMIYWTSQRGSSIWRSTLNGTNIGQVVSDIYKPIDTALCVGNACNTIPDPPIELPPPDPFRLDPAYPNPFSQSTTLRYALPEAQPVTLEVYDVLGRRVALLAEGIKEKGVHEVIWESNVSGGMYLVVLRTFSGRQHVLPIIKAD